MSSADGQPSRLDISRRVDQICEKFESSWMQGVRLRIEDSLQGSSHEQETLLLRELLGIEFELRLQAGEELSLPEYLGRFPQHSDLIQQVYGQTVPNAVPLATFLSLVEQSNLLSDEQVATVRNESARTEPCTSKQLAQRFVNDGDLTRWQAEMLLGGQFAFFLGKYKLLDWLGTGGMGTVLKAQHTVLDRTVAIKVISDSILKDRSAVKRFRREMRAAAAFHHPNIVLAYDADSVADTHFLVMEYVGGLDLGRLAKQSGNELPIGWVCECARQAAMGLSYAQKLGMVHRDIKPSNLIVTQPEGERAPAVKILDLGLSRAVAEVETDGSVTGIGDIVGTPDYIAPEQARDAHSADIRSDIFSLGCTLFRLLADRLPFQGKSTTEKLSARFVGDTPALHPFRADIPAELDAIVAKMLARDPEQRYEHPDEVVDALKPFCKLESPEVNPIAALTRADDDRTEIRVFKVKADNDTGLDKLVQQLTTGVDDKLSPLPAAARSELVDSRRRPTWPGGYVVASIVLLAILGLFATYKVVRNGSEPAEPEPIAASAHERADIPEHEMRIAGHGDPTNVPVELIAILGSGRIKNWSSVLQVALSPDGGVLAMGSISGRITLWDFRSGELLHSFLSHSQRATELAFSPDGTILASGSRDNTVRLWSVTTGKELHILRKHTDRVTSIAFHPAGTALASASLDKTVLIWNLVSGEEIPESVLEHPRGVAAVAYNTADATLVTYCDDRKLRIWDTHKAEVVKSFEGGVSSFKRVAISSDGKMLAANSRNSVILWDTTTEKSRTLSGHPKTVRGLAFSADGKTLATAGGYDHTVKLWDVATASERHSLRTTGQFVSCPVFSDDGGYLICAAGNDNNAIAWKLDENDEPKLLHRFAGHRACVTCLAFTSDGNTLASGSADGTVKLWDLKDYQESQTIGAHGGFVDAIAFSPDEGKLVTGAADSTLMIYDLSTHEKQQIETGFTPSPYEGRYGDFAIAAADFAPDGTLLATGGDGTIRLFDIGTGRETQRIDAARRGIWDIDFSPDGQSFVTGSLDKQVIVWGANGASRQPPLVGHSESVYCAAFSPNGQMIASGGVDCKIILWDMKANRRVRTLHGHLATVNSVSFEPHGRLLASCAEDGSVRLWDLKSYEPIRSIQIGPVMGNILDVAFSPDGNYLATANGNGTIYILHVRSAIAEQSRN